MAAIDPFSQGKKGLGGGRVCVVEGEKLKTASYLGTRFGWLPRVSLGSRSAEDCTGINARCTTTLPETTE